MVTLDRNGFKILNTDSTSAFKKATNKTHAQYGMVNPLGDSIRTAFIVEKKAKKAARKARYEAAKKLGLKRSDLYQHYNVDPKAFLIVERMAETEFDLNPNSCIDSYGVWGLDPHDVADVWHKVGRSAKFYQYIRYCLTYLKEFGRADYLRPLKPGKGMNFNSYKEQAKLADTIRKWCHNPDLAYESILKGDRKRLGKLSFFSKIIALNYAAIIEEENHHITCRIDWSKLAELLKSPKRVRAAYLPFPLAWSLLFKRKYPEGLEREELSPSYLADRVTQRTFRYLMSIVKSGSENEVALVANTRAAYHVAIAFRDQQTTERWIRIVNSKKAGDPITAINIHDAYVDAGNLVNTKFKSSWIKMLMQFPDLRWQINWCVSFEKEFDRAPSGVKEFREFVSKAKYENVTNPDVMRVAAELGIAQDEFEDYQNFFEKHPEKKATMLPNVVINKEGYIFSKLDDYDKRGPFLGLYTDCCQHLHNAGSSCAKAGWIDPESGFYVVTKGEKIVAQSWAWRGKKGELCFDSIEGLGNVNIDVVSKLYKEAAHQLLGKLGITRVTVGYTSYGITRDVRKHLGVNEETKPAKMIKKVSFTDADSQWLLAGEI